MNSKTSLTPKTRSSERISNKSSTKTSKTTTKKTSKSTPKKSSKSTPKKASKSTPNKTLKATPNKTRSPRTRTLPKSPISESMRQRNIKEFFKPISPTVPLVLSIACQSSNTDANEGIDVTNTTKPLLKRTKPSKEVVLSPVFGQQKPYSLRNSSNSLKRLRTDSNESQNSSSNESNLLSISGHQLSASTDGKSVQFSAKVSTHLETNTSEMSSDLEFNKKSAESVVKDITIDSKSVDISPENPVLSVYNTSEKLADNCGSDDDMDLIPVFKRVEPKVKKPKKGLKENINKYMDREKDKKMKYLLKNFSRIQRDREMLDIQPIDEIDFNVLIESKTEEPIEIVTEIVTEQSLNFIKPFEGIDIFCQFIPKTIDKYLTEEVINENFGQKTKRLFELPLNRLITIIPVLSKAIEDSERLSLIPHIIDLISTEDCPLICGQIETKTVDVLFENDCEIYLSKLLKTFYKILNKIHLNFSQFKRQSNIENNFSEEIEKQLKCLSNVLKIMTKVLNKCLFKVEAIESDKELIQFVVICFGLGLDYRLTESVDLVMSLKQLIAVILKHLVLDESNANEITKQLNDFCVLDEKLNIGLCLQLVSLFPSNTDFELKRKFCVSCVKWFAAKEVNDFGVDFNLNGIQSTLSFINWKRLTVEDIYSIIQFISLSMDLPNDLIGYKETISCILNELDFEVNTCVPKSSDFDVSDIHKLLMIMKTKVNVSTKRF